MTYSPMLSHPGKKDWLNKKNHIFELKLDGIRIILYKDSGIELINKKGTPKTQQYPELQNIGKFIKPKSCVLDGEIIIYDPGTGLPSFNLLQKRNIRARLAISHPVTYVVFDILEIEGKSLIDRPLYERKKILHDSIIEDRLIELTVETEDGKTLWKEVTKRMLEGVIAKRKDSLYHAGQRTWDWVKIKNLNTADVVIAGYTSYERNVSSLGMALYRKGKLTYVGKVGTGFSEEIIEKLKAIFSKYETSRPAVVNPPNEDMKWLKPELVAEVEYLQVTPDLQFRSSSFKGLRDDKPAKECTWEGQIKI